MSEKPAPEHIWSRQQGKSASAAAALSQRIRSMQPGDSLRLLIDGKDYAIKCLWEGQDDDR